MFVDIQGIDSVVFVGSGVWFYNQFQSWHIVVNRCFCNQHPQPRPCIPRGIICLACLRRRRVKALTAGSVAAGQKEHWKLQPRRRRRREVLFLLPSWKSVPQECPTRVSHKSVLPTRVSRTRVSYKSVPQECPVQECPTRVSYKSVPQ